MGHLLICGVAHSAHKHKWPHSRISVFRGFSRQMTQVDESSIPSSVPSAGGAEGFGTTGEGEGGSCGGF